MSPKSVSVVYDVLEELSAGLYKRLGCPADAKPAAQATVAKARGDVAVVKPVVVSSWLFFAYFLFLHIIQLYCLITCFGAFRDLFSSYWRYAHIGDFQSILNGCFAVFVHVFSITCFAVIVIALFLLNWCTLVFPITVSSVGRQKLGFLAASSRYRPKPPMASKRPPAEQRRVWAPSVARFGQTTAAVDAAFQARFARVKAIAKGMRKRPGYPDLSDDRGFYYSGF